MEMILLLMIVGFIFNDFTFAESNNAALKSHGPDLGSSELLDFCLADTFNASCSHGQVLLVLSARFGRMRKGRCVKGDYGLLGCAVDAQTDMDSLCSGLKECKFRIFDSKLRMKSVCPEDMASYLEASYQCIDVASAIGGQCGGQKQVTLTQPSGYLASIVSQDTGLGTVDCPWAVRALPGQRVTFYLRYFGYETRTPGGGVEGDSHSEVCYDLLTFREPGVSPYTISTCDGLPKAEREVFGSKTHEVHVQMVGRMQLRTLGRFIVRYQVTGCADMPPPFNATAKRDKDMITVKCNNSDHTWYLVCKNSSWLGDTINCNHVGAASAWNIHQIFDSSSFPFGILLVVAIGVALGIFCGGLLLTCVVVYMKRQRRLHQAMDDCTDFRNFDGYEGHVTGDLTELATPEDDLSPAGKAIHPYTTKHYTGGAQGSSSGVSSVDPVTEYDRQCASIKAYAAKTPAACPERCCYPSLISKNHLYEMPHAV